MTRDEGLNADDLFGVLRVGRLSRSCALGCGFFHHEGSVAVSGWDKAPEYGSHDGIWATVLSTIAGVLFSALIAWLVYSNAVA